MFRLFLILMLIAISPFFGFSQKEKLPLDSLLKKYNYFNTKDNIAYREFDEAYSQKSTILGVDASKWTKEQLDKINEFESLQLLVLQGYNRGYFPNCISDLKQLRVLEMGSWGTFTIFPEPLKSIKSLEYFDLSDSRIMEFPEKFDNLSSIKVLKLPEKMAYGEKVRIWEALPECKIIIGSFGNSKSPCNTHRPWDGYFSSIAEAEKYPAFVKRLRICNQEDLENISKLKAFKNLEELLFYDITIVRIPEELYELVNLKYLMINKCWVKEIPEGISKLKNLEQLILSTNKFKTFPKDFFRLPNLQELYLEQNEFETIPKDIGNLKNLRVLAFGIVNGDNLGTSVTPISELPQSFYKLKNLERLQLSYTNINKIPGDLKKLPKLKVVTINQELLEDEDYVSRLKLLLPNCRIE